jgi:long-subunit fatty acid transport protein
LTALGAPTLEIGATSVFARGSFVNAVNSGAALQSSPAVIPHGAFGMPLGHSRFAFGAGLVPEIGGAADWTYADTPGAAGATYGVQHYTSRMLGIRSVAGLGYSFNRTVAIGASLGVVYNSDALRGPAVFQTQPGLAGFKALLDAHSSGWGRNYSLGILVSPNRSLQLGAAWKSRTVIDSQGTANGDLSVQLAALGSSVRPDFTYASREHHVFPQSFLAHAAWKVHPRWLLAFQANWVNWKSAFASMPLYLTNGNNADINHLLGSASLNDVQPLGWKDQITFHGGFERPLTENVTLRGGFAHGNNPVPSSTLTPLNAAIFKDRATTGLGYRRGRATFDLAYLFGFEGHASVGRSAVLSGEYSNSRVSIGTQALTLNTSFQF